MSRQVDWSSGAAEVEDVGGAGDVVGCDGAAVGELAGDVSLDVEADEELPFEQPAVMTAMATIPASAVGFTRTKHSFARQSICCRHPTGNFVSAPTQSWIGLRRLHFRDQLAEGEDPLGVAHVQALDHPAVDRYDAVPRGLGLFIGRDDLAGIGQLAV